MGNTSKRALTYGSKAPPAVAVGFRFTDGPDPRQYKIDEFGNNIHNTTRVPGIAPTGWAQLTAEGKAAPILTERGRLARLLPAAPATTLDHSAACKRLNA